MQNYWEQAGLWLVANIPYFKYDSELISALVEQWRPATHTFYLSYEECTMILLDVTFQLGLCVDGKPANRCTYNCETILNRDI